MLTKRCRFKLEIARRKHSIRPPLQKTPPVVPPTEAHFEAFYKVQIAFFPLSFANLPFGEIWWVPEPAFFRLALWFTLHICNFGVLGGREHAFWWK